MMLTDPSGRYLLLETLRQFGEEQLQVKENPDRFRRAHMKYFTALAVAGHDGLQGPDEGVWWRRLQADWATSGARSDGRWLHKTWMRRPPRRPS